MSQSAETTVPFVAPESKAASPAEPKKADPKPTRPLPTNRMAFAKQLDVVRAFGAISGPDNTSVTNLEVSKIVGLHHATVGLITPFLVDIGLLQKRDGALTPVPEVCDCTRAYEWGPTEAFQRVAPILRKSWFFTALSTKLRFKPMPREAALQELALAANAAPSYRGQLETLIEYLSEAGLVVVEGDQVRMPHEGKPDASSSSPSGNGSSARQESHQAQQPPARESSVSSNFAAQSPGHVQFDIHVKVGMAEFANWQPSRISAFFAGIAQVLAAKGAVEERSTKS